MPVSGTHPAAECFHASGGAIVHSSGPSYILVSLRGALAPHALVSSFNRSFVTFPWGMMWDKPWVSRSNSGLEFRSLVLVFVCLGLGARLSNLSFLDLVVFPIDSSFSVGMIMTVGHARWHTWKTSERNAIKRYIQNSP